MSAINDATITIDGKQVGIRFHDNFWRDYFAAAALPPLIERMDMASEASMRKSGDDLPEDTTDFWQSPLRWHDAAWGAYAVADAMIAAREARP